MNATSAEAAAPEQSPPANSSLPGLTQAEDFAQHPSTNSVRLPSLRTVSDLPPVSQASMTASSTPLGSINAARRPAPPHLTASSVRNGGLPQDMQAKMKAFHASRQGAPPSLVQRGPSSAVLPPTGPISGDPTSPTSAPTPGGPLVGGMAGFRLPPNARPLPQNHNSAPAIPHARMSPKLGLAAKRGLNRGMKLTDATGPPAPTLPGQDDSKTNDGKEPGGKPETSFSKYSEFIDTKTGTLKFKGKATIHTDGIDFSSGSSFSISLDEVDNLEELGKGNYGTVYKVRHSRPRMRRPGLGLKGNQAPPSLSAGSTASSRESFSPESESPTESLNSPTTRNQGNTTGVIMAMKEIRLELDEAKFAAIIMELDILHRCLSPFIIDFYGAFFQEGAVYICMEFMDGGSIDKLYGDGIPENVLRKITLSTIMGLKSLKDDHNIIHRDVKPTNILVNTKGQVKICDFGVSGNLVASIAKTNIGCQSYMAPERIASGGVAQAGANPGGGTYSVQSDIWSLGLSIIECAMGQYPYPPETYNNIFSQLSAIVDGDPPSLPPGRFSPQAHSFVSSCLHKVPKLRPTYAMLMQHPWLSSLMKPPTISEDEEEEEEEQGLGAPISQIANLSLTEGDETSIITSPTGGLGGQSAGNLATADKEVAAWVLGAIEKKRQSKNGGAPKPALHTAPLNAVPSPSIIDSAKPSNNSTTIEAGA